MDKSIIVAIITGICSIAIALINNLKKQPSAPPVYNDLQSLSEKKEVLIEHKKAFHLRKKYIYIIAFCLLIVSIGIFLNKLLVNKPQEVNYNTPIAIELANYGLKLSGGKDVRTNTDQVNTDNTWVIVNATNTSQTGPINYGDKISFQLPFYSNVKLSGGNNGMRTNTQDIYADEIWTIQNS